MLKFSAVSQIWKKYIQKLNDWDLPLIGYAIWAAAVIMNKLWPMFNVLIVTDEW